MMKLTKIFIAAFALTFAAIVSTQATTSEVKSADEVVLKIDPKKTEITPSELPASIKDAIMGGEFAKWNIAKVYKITYSDDKEKVEYEVHFANEKKQKQIKVYNKDGGLIED
ncbi:hypothetical protein LVD17_11320 [Fulvivirga ulvae]|uniref:hypothetical protein n=1 Tax=Fulvivirga ulvae TaxID=2904245 RepID=UPI001F2AB373|nr:hypothetical protein [Fulvivirga ulvae]UII34399.1 hypothetical protein LVD17_11320 [Fulvivirga ulvae]